MPSNVPASDLVRLPDKEGESREEGETVHMV